MLKELGKEIMALLEEKEGKDVQIAELKKENEELRAAVEPLNVQIANLQAELETKVEEITDKDALLAEKENKIVELQEQADLKLNEVKAIVDELKGLIANA